MKAKFFAALLMTALFASCGEEDCNHKGITPDNKGDENKVTVVGNWYQESTNEEMRYNASGTFYDKYCNTTSHGETEGRWEWDEANKRLTTTYQYMGQTQFSDWTVRNLTDFKLVIYNKTVGDQTLEKITESHALAVGETAQLKFATDYADQRVISYTSKSPRIASVTEDGQVKAEGEKGTAYIKITTSTGNVWAKVVVGNEVADLWYDYPTLMGMDLAQVKEVLGNYDVKGDDGYSYGYRLNYHDLASEIDLFLNKKTGLVDEMAMALRSSAAVSEIESYLASHYYPCSELGADYYTTGPTVEQSACVVRYDKTNKCIRFLTKNNIYPDPLPDYTDMFGYTTEQLSGVFGDLLSGEPMFFIDNDFFDIVYFNIDKETQKTTAYSLMLKSDIDAEVLHTMLSMKYNNYRNVDNSHAYCEGNTLEESQLMIVFNEDNRIVTVFDRATFGKSSASAPQMNMFSSFPKKVDAIAKLRKQAR